MAFSYDMEFPVLGDADYGASFGAPRDGGARMHAGVDIFAPTLTPVVAVADAVVENLRNGADGRCCYLGLLHDDGWRSWYIHLNNDHFGTDNGEAVGIRADLVEGMAIRAGELIGWVGDSGNAETTPPHLHFELHDPGDTPIDPFASLADSQNHAASAIGPQQQAALDPSSPLVVELDPAEARIGQVRPNFVGPFLDDDGHSAEGAFAVITALGVPTWCDEWGIRSCPDDPATGALVEGWVSQLLSDGRDPSVAILYPLNELDPDQNRNTAAGCGATRLCPDQPVTWGETAAMLAGAIGDVVAVGPDAAVEVLANRHYTGCDDWSSSRVVTRGELAEVLMRVMGYTSSPDCDWLD